MKPSSLTWKTATRSICLAKFESWGVVLSTSFLWKWCYHTLLLPENYASKEQTCILYSKCKIEMWIWHWNSAFGPMSHMWVWSQNVFERSHKLQLFWCKIPWLRPLRLPKVSNILRLLRRDFCWGWWHGKL